MSALLETLPEAVQAAIRGHAEAEYPRECCGLLTVVRGKPRYVPCRNVAESAEHFVIHPEDQAAVEDAGGILAVVHSHPNLPPVPSDADRVGCEASGVPWLIVNWPTGAMASFAPSGFRPHLLGRQFSHGVLDCFSLVRDYYLDVLGIALPEYHRDSEWWLKGQNLYLDNADGGGFVRVDEPAPHDVLLMQIGSPVPNHAAVFLGDGCIMHHQTHRLSSRDVYGGWYRKVTTHIYRHRDLFT